MQIHMEYLPIKFNVCIMNKHKNFYVYRFKTYDFNTNYKIIDDIFLSEKKTQGSFKFYKKHTVDILNDTEFFRKEIKFKKNVSRYCLFKFSCNPITFQKKKIDFKNLILLYFYNKLKPIAKLSICSKKILQPKLRYRFKCKWNYKYLKTLDVDYDILKNEKEMTYDDDYSESEYLKNYTIVVNIYHSFDNLREIIKMKDTFTLEIINIKTNLVFEIHDKIAIMKNKELIEKKYDKILYLEDIKETLDFNFFRDCIYLYM